MKKILIILVFLLIVFVGFISYDHFITNKIPRVDISDSIVDINKLYIYGTHLNIEGTYSFEGDAELVFYNGKFLSYKINSNKDSRGYKFNISNLLNDGIHLDDIPIGEYYMFLRVKDSEKSNEENIVWKYYSLKNNTEYVDTTYYTMSNYNKKILITNENTYPTMIMKVSKNKDNNVYDVVIDPGHGGKDGGANKNGYKETDFSLDIATKVKESLENYGLKVKLTHEIGQLNSNEKLNEYGVHGRAVIPREVNAKYLFSIHLNGSSSSSVSGLEVYSAKNINYDLAKTLVNNITTITGLGYSNNKINKVANGLYSRNFTQEDIEESLKEYEDDNLKAYDITTNSNYYYMIRETGGIVTGAYVDDRNDKIIHNPYVYSNVGTESYILELGYISNNNDLQNIINKKEQYILAIVNSIRTVYDDVK